MSVILSSTTDTPEQVAAALIQAGYEAPSVETIADAGAEIPSADDAEPSEPPPPDEAAEGETAEDSEASEDSPEEEKPKEKKRDRGLQQRFSELTRARKEAEQRAAALERRLAALEQSRAEPAPPPEPAPAAEPPPEKPRVDSYQNYEEYVEAVAEWKLAERDRGRAQAQAEARARDAERAQAAAWGERQEAARLAHADYDAAVNQDLLISPAMQQAMLTSDAGAEVAYHLGKNPDECRRIAALDPMSAARAIGRLEAQLAAAPLPSSPEPPKPKATSAAPPPLHPVAAASAARGTPNFEAMSFAEYEAWHEQRRRPR